VKFFEYVQEGDWSVVAGHGLFGALMVPGYYQVCHPMNFSNPKVKPRKTITNTNQRNASKVPVNASTLNI
jgi:hypothetical protein